MKYELINPSDKIEFEAESDEIALLCVLNISSAYAAENLETGWKSPFGMFGYTEDDLIRDLGRDVETFCELYRDEINACFKSFHCVHERTSLNDICKYANGLKVKPEA
jgi:hypothetical protein